MEVQPLGVEGGGEGVSQHLGFIMFLYFQGVPLRVELGPRDMEKEECVLVIRDNGQKETHKINMAVPRIKEIFEEMQQRMLDRYVLSVVVW